MSLGTAPIIPARIHPRTGQQSPIDVGFKNKFYLGSVGGAYDPETLTVQSFPEFDLKYGVKLKGVPVQNSCAVFDMSNAGLEIIQSNSAPGPGRFWSAEPGESSDYGIVNVGFGFIEVDASLNGHVIEVHYQSLGTVNAIPGDGLIGGTFGFLYEFDDVIFNANPGNGKFRLNNAVQDTATAMYISKTDFTGNDLSTTLAIFTSGNVRLLANTGKWLLFTISALIDHGAFVELMIALMDGTDVNPFILNDHVGAYFTPPGGGGGGSPVSYARVSDGTTRGATNTEAVCYGTVDETSGGDFTRTPSAANGDSFLINTSGIYIISASLEQANGSSIAEIRVGSAIDNSFGDAKTRSVGQSFASGARFPLAWAGYIAAGQYVWTFSDSPLTANSFNNQFTIAGPIKSGNGGAGITEYASNSDTTNASDTVSFASGPGGSPIPVVASTTKKKRIQWQTPVLDTDDIKFEVKPSGLMWVDGCAAGYQHDETSLVEYGISLYPVSTTEMDVVFWTAGIVSGLSGGSSTWPAENGLGTLWRVSKSPRN